ncbi:eukaryotic translation initiation factor 3 subunit G [Cladorrhinum sp. PSN332]|nr:eukaryotic translation initiation factor 3 subunit G [Cladorrhinum sp. PSN332]
MSEPQVPASAVAGLEPLQNQTSNSKRLRPPALKLGGDEAEKVPLRADDKLHRRESRLGLRNIFSRNKGGADGEKTPITPNRPGGLRASIAAGVSNWPYGLGSAGGQRSESPLPPLKHKKSTSAVRGQTPPDSIANWNPPALFQAYPQSIKHAHLPACTASPDSVLRLNHKSTLSFGGLNLGSPSVENFEEVTGEQNEKPKRRHHRRNTSGVSAKLEWTSKVFILVTSGYLLQYTGEGSYDRLPEKILHLGKDSAAFASDAIPGRHWVLQVSSVADPERAGSSQSSSLLSRLPFRGQERRYSSNFLMVFEGAEEMESWITILRREIEALGGRRVLSETGKPKMDDEDMHLKSQTSQRTLVVRDPDRFSRITSPDLVWGRPDIQLEPADEEVVREQSFDETSSASVISHDGRQLDALRDSTNRFSYISSGQRTMVTSAGSSPACSPMRDSFAEHDLRMPDLSQLDENLQPKLRPNAAAINDRRQSLQATNHMLELQLASGQSLRPRSTLSNNGQSEMPLSPASHTPINSSIPHSAPPMRMSSRRPPPSAISINPRPLSLVIDQPSPLSSPTISPPRAGSQSIDSTISSASGRQSIFLPIQKHDGGEGEGELSTSFRSPGAPPPRPRRPSECSDRFDEDDVTSPGKSSLISPYPRSASSLGRYGGTRQSNSMVGSQNARTRRSSFSSQPSTSPPPLSPFDMSQRPWAPPLNSVARSSQHLRVDSTISKALLERRSMSQLAEGPPPAPPPTRALPPIPQQKRNSAKHDWADDDDLDEVSTDLPPPQKIQNKDGTTTIIEYRYNDEGQKVKTTRRIRYITHREVVNPRVAERKQWAKFGQSAKDGPGPAHDTTTVGENIIFKPSMNWRKDARDESKDPNAQAMKDKLKDKKVKCRICNGEHFTARCPYKDTMAPIGEPGAGSGDVAAGMGDEAGAGPAAAGAAGAGKKGSYVPPALRGAGAGGAGAGAGERMGGKYGERDDLATLRVTNVSEMAEENELRDMFERFGRVTRVFLAKDRDTGMAKGFAFISFADRGDAVKACEKMDGFGFRHLILRVEFAKKAQ